MSKLHHSWALSSFLLGLAVGCGVSQGAGSQGDSDADVLTQALGAGCEEVELLARKTYNPSTWFDAERQLPTPKRFRLPAEAPIVSGNSGNHWITFTYFAGGVSVACRYQGGASQAHPNSPAQLALAQRYVFKSCANGLAAGTVFEADLLRLRLDNGDSYQPDTQVKLVLAEEQPCGGGEPGCDPATVTDGNPCTQDTCDPHGQPAFAALPAGSSCADGDLCNGEEVCDGAGACVPGEPVATGDGNQCTLGVCDPATGVVSHAPAPAGTPCSLDACTEGATCDGVLGDCVGGWPRSVDDGLACTLDSCDPITGPVHRACGTVDPTVATSMPAALAFLFSGPDPIQTGVTPGALEPRRMSAVHGTVLQASGQPLPSVVVTAVGHPEFGQTTTRADGRFDLVVNGGGLLTLDFKISGFLEAQRSLHVGWQEWPSVPSVTLIQADAIVSPIDLNSTEALQVARASMVSDADGARQATLLVPSGTTAIMEMPNGSSQPITELDVRITEFTVGPEGPSRMPATLPPASRYTYAFEVNADQAVAAGADTVRFSQPLVYYVENFLGFPTGEPVPVGSYNRKKVTV